MGLIHWFVDFVLHMDEHLTNIVQDYGMWTYAILFLIVFCETGLVVTPFLPGDSLLFAAGTLSALDGGMDPLALFVLLAIAAIAGDSVNYTIGNYIGPKIFHYEKIRFFKKENLMKAHQFFEKYGGRSIFFARFIPFFRTFVPFVAGVGSMTYSHFLFFNVFGGIFWVGLFVFGGYFFGNLPVVKENFSLIIIAIIFISLVPVAVEWLRHRLKPVKNSV